MPVRVGNVERKRIVASPVRADLVVVHRHVAAPIDGTEVEKYTFAVFERGAIEGATVPEIVRLADRPLHSGELRGIDEDAICKKCNSTIQNKIETMKG